MTEREFNETINNMYDIYDFCTENPKYDYITDDVYNNEHMVDFLKNLLKDMNFESVQSLLDFVDEIPDSDWYYVQGGCIYALDFEELKNDLLEDLRSEEFFTDEELINNEDSQNNTDMWVDINNNTDTDDDIIANDISLLYL